MRATSLIRALLPFRLLSVRDARIDDFGNLIVRVAVRGVSRCGGCEQKRPRYDRGDGTVPLHAFPNKL